MVADRKALVVGIDHYAHLRTLSGCVNDAKHVASMLSRHADSKVNFSCKTLVTTDSTPVNRGDLKEATEELFRDDVDIALLFFAGHGYLSESGGYLCTSESSNGDDGLTNDELMRLVNGSPAKNKVIILDSCHSGAVGSSDPGALSSSLKEGVTLLCASGTNQYAEEREGGGSGIFTDLLIDALDGAAANLLGEVTPGGIYAHIDQSLGAWRQRPVFKTNVKTFVSLRKTAPAITEIDLHALHALFPTAGFDFPLDPSFEPHRSGSVEEAGWPDPDPVNTASFALLQRCVKVNLVRPVDAEHMYFAAINSKSCRLTVTGEHYWRLVDQDLI